ncbi:DUF6600 domain-containing protein [Undibacterium sp. TJN25]|uniref:DUF6600 domain-containing protein n=1 Tax=Undibacterium sp. TJN25 TaxID=3413056 RepID=UPI003BF1CE77
MKLFTSSRAAFKSLACAAALLSMLSVLGTAHAQTDPPGRVARLNYISGSVTFAPAASDQWAYAELNRPLTVGDSVWADSGARAELHIGSSAVRMESTTSLSVLDLTDDMVQLKLSQGSLSVRIRSLPNNQNFEIDTPNLAFAIQEPGEYRLSVAADGSATTVTVRQGIGIAYGDNDSLTLHENEQMRFSGTGLAQAALGTAAPFDAFDAWARGRDRAEEVSVSATYVSRETIGYEQLDSYGTWSNDPEYGAVWMPRAVAVTWTPYRNGHWTWVAPWGWTWIDDAPWGFAPFHYGRWAHIRSGWCWVPGPRHISPVYAPALVAFVGGNNGASFGLSISSGPARGPGVAWFPLAPGERYQPGYRVSPRYISRVNETIIIRGGNNNIVRDGYRNRDIPNAVIAMPAAAFVKGQPVGPVARAMRPHEFDRAEIATAGPQLAPVRESILGNAKPAGMPAGAHLWQRPVVATVAPPVAPARQDALAQQFAQHAGPAIPGVGPALVRQQTGAQAVAPVLGQGSRNPPDNRGRQASQRVDPSNVRIAAGAPRQAQTDRRNNAEETRPAVLGQPNVIGNVQRGAAQPSPAPVQQEAGRGQPQAPGANGTMQNLPRQENTPAFENGNRQQMQPAYSDGRNAPPSVRQPMPATPAQQMPQVQTPAVVNAPTAGPAVPQPPREARPEYRPTLERRSRDGLMPEQREQQQQQEQQRQQREALRNQIQPMPAQPAHIEPAPTAQPPQRPQPRPQEIAQPPQQQPQQPVQPQRRMERQEPMEIRREAPPRPAPVAQPAPMPAPAPAPAAARQEKEVREKNERGVPKKVE